MAAIHHITVDKDEFERVLMVTQTKIAKNLATLNSGTINEGDTLVVHCEGNESRSFACVVADASLYGETDFLLLISVCKVGLIAVPVKEE